MSKWKQFSVGCCFGSAVVALVLIDLSKKFSVRCPMFVSTVSPHQFPGAEKLLDFLLERAVFQLTCKRGNITCQHSQDSLFLCYKLGAPESSFVGQSKCSSMKKCVFMRLAIIIQMYLTTFQITECDI